LENPGRYANEKIVCVVLIAQIKLKYISAVQAQTKLFEVLRKASPHNTLH
jgi:hypothetical protein